MGRGLLTTAAVIAMASSPVGLAAVEVAREQEERRIIDMIRSPHCARQRMCCGKSGASPKHRKWSERKERRRKRQKKARAK